MKEQLMYYIAACDNNIAEYQELAKKEVDYDAYQQLLRAAEAAQLMKSDFLNVLQSLG